MSMEILETSGIYEAEADYRKNIYKMTASSAPKVSFKEYVEKPFRIRGYLKFKDIEKNKVILSILTEDGTVLSGDSKTIQESLDEIIAAFAEEVPTIDVLINAQESKNGRTFLSLIVC